MILGAAIGGLMAGPAGGEQNGIYFGFFNGAWWALLTSFAWPWIMPSQRSTAGCNRSEVG